MFGMIIEGYCVQLALKTAILDSQLSLMLTRGF